MNVELLQHTSLAVCAHAIRTCWSSHDKSDDGGPIDLALIDRVGNKNKHASTLEHLSYTFFISGISRALLQELARHRIASPSVQSTRYTLSKLLKQADLSFATASDFLVLTGDSDVDQASFEALCNLQTLVRKGISNDKLKYALPESFKVELTWTINARSLQNFLTLRSNKAALWEIRDLANAIYLALPPEHTYLFEHCLMHDVQPTN